MLNTRPVRCWRRVGRVLTLRFFVTKMWVTLFVRNVLQQRSANDYAFCTSSSSKVQECCCEKQRYFRPSQTASKESWQWRKKTSDTLLWSMRFMSAVALGPWKLPRPGLRWNAYKTTVQHLHVHFMHRKQPLDLVRRRWLRTSLYRQKSRFSTGKQTFCSVGSVHVGRHRLAVQVYLAVYIGDRGRHTWTDHSLTWVPRRHPQVVALRRPPFSISSVVTASFHPLWTLVVQLAKTL